MIKKIKQPSQSIIDHLLYLAYTLQEEEKLELIAKLSQSILKTRQNARNNKTKEEILLDTFGSFQSQQSAEHLIQEIYDSRNFRDKNYQL